MRTPNGVAEMHQFYSGPIPPASELAAFEKITPGLADRIVAMAERQSAHRQDLETRIIKSDIFRSNLGMTLGFIVAIVGLLVSGWTISTGQGTAGAIIGSATLAAMVTAFVTGRNFRKSDIEKKQGKQQ